MPGKVIRTSIQEVTVANKRITQETAKALKLNEGTVDGIIRFVAHYCTEVISSGGMETIMIPKFGKFKPKEKALKAQVKISNNVANGKDLIYRAMTGKRIIDLRPGAPRINPPEDEGTNV